MSPDEDPWAAFEPSAVTREFAAVLRQLYVALRKEGFGERQALVLIGQLLVANAGGAK